MNPTDLHAADNADTVISVEQVASNDEAVVPNSLEDTRQHHLQSEADNINVGEEIRPTSPPFPLGFRYPNHSLRGDYTPSIRSAHYPGHQQSMRPFSPSYRSDSHPPLGGHRFADGSQSAGRDASKLPIIDYAGLDASVTEATFIEHGFEKTTFTESTNLPESGNTKEPKKSLDRAASTASSVKRAPSSGSNVEFRRRSARKASFYSERAPR
ncbi:hypothetical protein BGZ80_002279, partial [Entomortierella chlamydospora]